MKWFVLVCSTVALTACQTGVVTCKEGTDYCGNGCVDAKRDRRNCGACGNQCGTGQDCMEGAGAGGASACVCRPGTTTCATGCAVTGSDPLNCGGCGIRCPEGQICSGGVCQWPF